MLAATAARTAASLAAIKTKGVKMLKKIISFLDGFFDCITPEGIWVAVAIVLAIMLIGYAGYSLLILAYGCSGVC